MAKLDGVLRDRMKELYLMKYKVANRNEFATFWWQNEYPSYTVTPIASLL